MNSVTLQTQAREFRRAYGIQSSEIRAEMQKALIDEEWSEFHEAFHLGTDEEEFKELCDLVYVCYQYAENLGWDLDEAMDRVHKSNMSKLGRDGKPIYREDGKVLKGPMYRPPNLKDLIK